MKKTPLLIAGLATALGTLSFHIYLSRFEHEVAGGTPRRVVTLTRDLSMGDVVERQALGSRLLPELFLEERHVLAEHAERILGARVLGRVDSGSALLWTDLDTMQSTRTLSGLVRHGMRAFPLPEEGVDFDGLLRPGDRVDLLFTASGAQPETKTLLQNVLVLTVGHDLGQAEAHDEGSRHSGQVTLSVSLSQAQLLAHSVGRGRLFLSLRNPQDLMLADGIEPTRQLSTAAEGQVTRAR